ncbi:uncharacterized protein SCODWIG_00816 [Saccharomycodes ludwigii]|uniref:AAA+ ATPase domain-containing protein n=1 Tax=Saccharomycodes ludwigii TaxID=36035 RepID=A0A376B2Z8_9ASCO|nr:hypothetical protein SCDLUD_004113 [Saccharomycodes ludwigii]KAH3899820.1 hypothetical protein SCDLUD_004113 [Saccharomycodes ludwigii]SSD59055.1 uncharacterized protein SCODWIG_00816 [Saccharomycodes ludwigii]
MSDPLSHYCQQQNENTITYTSSTGKFITIKKKEQQGISNPDNNIISNSSFWKNGSNYGIDINTLMDNINKKKEEKQKQHDHNRSTTNKNSTDKNNTNKGTLWAEKWRPSLFLDLVGNEKNNRKILKWLRHWAPLVFQEDLPKNFFTNSIVNTSNKDVDIKEDLEKDILQRPAKKILLIYGSPGIGKTTVAHVLSKQAGFTPREINASDERAGTKLKDKLTNTLFNASVDKNDSPVCLICDEIDGSIENGIIKNLIDILNKDIVATKELGHSVVVSATDNVAKNKLKSKTKALRSKILTRPIIIICNNLYSKPLEKLRSYCEIIHFHKPNEKELLTRLELICKTEKINASKKTLMKLIEICQSDIRNCINNLQFLSNNNSTQGAGLITLDVDINNNEDNNQNIEKDVPLPWYQLVQLIFQKNPKIDGSIIFLTLLNKLELQSFSTIDRIISGCFNNYSIVKYSDIGSVNKPSALSNWLYFYDLLQGKIYSTNGGTEFEVLRYAYVIPLVFHELFADVTNFRNNHAIDFQFGNKFSSLELRNKISNLRNIVDLIKKNLTPCDLYIYYNSNSQIFINELLPYVNILLNTDYLKTITDSNLRNKVVSENIIPLIHINIPVLKFIVNGKNEQFLDVSPPIYKIVEFGTEENNYGNVNMMLKRNICYKYLLSKLEEYKINNKRKRSYENEKNTSGSVTNTNNSNKKVKKSNIVNNDNIVNHNISSTSPSSTNTGSFTSIAPTLDNNTDKRGKSKPTNAFEFFKMKTVVPLSDKDVRNGADGIVTIANDMNKNKKEGLKVEEDRVWVKYKEGFSNAVRKKVTWKTLFE